MTAQQLKNSILQLAVQGKLVPQDPNDEPASVLLERIRAEKEALIKAKKIKREKNPSVIFRGADNTPYEKIGNETVELEVPFDIPDSWEWCRLVSVNDMYTGNSINETEKKLHYTGLSDGRFYIGTKDVGFDHVITYDNGVRIPFAKDQFRIAPRDSILLCIEGGSAGRKIAFTNQDVCFGNKLCCFVSFGIDYKFLYYYLQSPLFQAAFKENTTGIIGGVSVNTLKAMLLPVPPLAEQKRIVCEIEKYEPLLEQYDAAEQALTKLNTSFPEQLKKSILQWAVQGKLVPQAPTDEPAEALLERIRGEKERLVREGKIKKDKHESVIFRRDNSHYEKRGSETVCIDSELPFEIPESWAWARLSSFGIFSSGKTPSMANPSFWNGNVPWVSSKDMKKPIIIDSEMHISNEAARDMQLYPSGTLLLVARSGILRRLLPLCVLGVDSTINQDIKAFSLYNLDLSEWLFFAIKAFEPYILKELVKSVTTVESLKFDEFSRLLIPVPPMAEQQRIIKALKHSIKLIKPLSNNPLFSL